MKKYFVMLSCLAFAMVSSLIPQDVQRTMQAPAQIVPVVEQKMLQQNETENQTSVENTTGSLGYPGTKWDQYEMNNDFQEATLISPTPSGKPTDFSVSRNATLHRNVDAFNVQKSVDVDFWKVNVYGRGIATFSLTNVPSTFNYNLDIYTFPNQK